MKCEIHWMRAARTEMQKIRNYLRVNRPDVEYHVINLISKAVAGLADFPFQGDVYHRSNGDEIRQIIAASYRIFFRVIADEKRIEILKVWHSSRDEPSFDE
jgi:plasmid stabilization system protein ParE